MKRPRDAGRPRYGLQSHLVPRKSLGQNFLRDENICRKIIASVNPQPLDVVLEIGPGEGALTKYLDGKVDHLVVVDVDKRVVDHLKDVAPGVTAMHEDILRVDLAALSHIHGKPLRVVGNIPYNITSPILFHLLSHRFAVSDATLMVQREVAERLVAQCGTKDYGILSVFFQLFTSVELLFNVSRNAFYPKPDVTSSVIQFTMLSQPAVHVADERFFRSMIRSVFGKRRKMLRSSLKYFCDEWGLALPDNEDLTKRPEDLSIGALAELSNVLLEKRPSR
jgi:16S rRNA (adenine1518-N6/adenine1519-N6)-dimethyltransferase